MGSAARGLGPTGNTVRKPGSVQSAALSGTCGRHLPTCGAEGSSLGAPLPLRLVPLHPLLHLLLSPRALIRAGGRRARVSRGRAHRTLRQLAGREGQPCAGEAVGRATPRLESGPTAAAGQGKRKCPRLGAAPAALGPPRPPSGPEPPHGHLPQ